VRGSIQDLTYFGSLIIGLAFLGYIFLYITTTTTTTGLLVAGQMGASSNATVAISQTKVAAQNFMGVIPIVMAVGGLSIIFLAAFIPVSPIFLPIGILMLLISVVIFYNVQQALPGVFASSFFAPLVAQYPLPAAIVNNIGLIVLVLGAGLLIVMYGRNSGAGRPEG